MSRIKAREYLNQLAQANETIDKKCAKLCQILSACEKSTTSITDMPKGEGGSGREDLYVKYIELKKEIDVETDVFVKAQRPIYAIQDETLRLLLVCRYIRGWPWALVANEIGRTEDMARIKLHARAIAELETVLDTICCVNT